MLSQCTQGNVNCRDLSRLHDANSRVTVFIIHSPKFQAPSIGLIPVSGGLAIILTPCVSSKDCVHSLLRLAQESSCDIPNVCFL